MQASLGELVVSLSANIAQFTNAMTRAELEAQRRSAAMEKAFHSASAALATIGTVVATGFLARMAADAVNAADEIGKMSERTGLAAETLSGYRHAAMLSDVANEDLEKSLVKLNVKMGEARDGSKEAQQALARFGVDANVDGTAEAFAKIADRVKATGDAATTASAMNDVFGKSFASLIPLLSGGQQGLKDAADEAARFGQVVSTDFAAQAAQFNDDMSRMKAGITGFAMEIASVAVPQLNTFIGQIQDARAAGLGVIEAIQKLGTADPSKGAAEQIARVSAEIEKLENSSWWQKSLIENLGGKELVDQLKREREYWRAQLLRGGTGDAMDNRLGGAPAGPGIAAKPPELPKPPRLGRTPAAPQMGDMEAFIFDLAEKQRQAEEQALESVRTSLQTQEEAVAESYLKRRQIIEDATSISKEQQEQMRAALENSFGAQIQALADSREQQRQSMYAGLLSEEEEILASYRRRKAQILESTLITEQEQAELVLRLDADLAARRKALEDAHNMARYQAASQFFDGMAGLAQAFAGKQSAVYRVLFAASKAFAIADAAIKVQQAIANAAASGPFPWNLAAMASVIGATSGLVSQIASINYAGQFDAGGNIAAGKWGIVGERGPEIVHGPASITGRQDTARMLKDLSGREVGMAAPVVKVRSINVLDSQAIGDFIGSERGEQIVINHIRANPEAIRRVAAS